MSVLTKKASGRIMLVICVLAGVAIESSKHLLIKAASLKPSEWEWEVLFDDDGSTITFEKPIYDKRCDSIYAIERNNVLWR